MVSVKIVYTDGKPYGFITKGSIGCGFGAWARAARIRDQLGLGDFPKALEESAWKNLHSDMIKNVQL